MLGAVHVRARANARRSSARSSSSPSRPPRIRGSSPSGRQLGRKKAELKKLIGKDIAAAYKLTDKSARSNALNDARAKAQGGLRRRRRRRTRWPPTSCQEARGRHRPQRDPQGRQPHRRPQAPDQVRPIEATVGFLPRTHGSALFTRGETQAICTTTLGTKDSRADDRRPDRPLATRTSCCTTTSRPIRSAKSAASARRAAAKSATASSPGARCTRCCRPKEEFPYTIRILSDITESNGSSSMATVCGGSPGDDGCRRADRSARSRASRWA